MVETKVKFRVKLIPNSNGQKHSDSELSKQMRCEGFKKWAKLWTLEMSSTLLAPTGAFEVIMCHYKSGRIEITTTSSMQLIQQSNRQCRRCRKSFKTSVYVLYMQQCLRKFEGSNALWHCMNDAMLQEQMSSIKLGRCWSYYGPWSTDALWRSRDADRVRKKVSPTNWLG